MAKNETGTTPGMSFDDYVAIEAINQSVLKHVEFSPQRAYEVMAHPKGPTPDMLLGQAFHTRVLERELFDREWAVGLVTASGRAMARKTAPQEEKWKAWEQANAGKRALRPADWEMLHRMADSVDNHPTAQEVLGGPGANEATMVWEDPETEALCKARVDRIGTFGKWSVLADLKSTKDASPEGFGREIARYKYHFQASWYLWGAEVLSPRLRRFLFVCVEKTPPYLTCVHEPDWASLEVGRELARRYLTQFVECQRSGIWEGYPTGIVNQSLPAWAHKEIEEEVDV